MGSPAFLLQTNTRGALPLSLPLLERQGGDVHAPDVGASVLARASPDHCHPEEAESCTRAGFPTKDLCILWAAPHPQRNLVGANPGIYGAASGRRRDS